MLTVGLIILVMHAAAQVDSQVSSLGHIRMQYLFSAYSTMYACSRRTVYACSHNTE